MRKALLFAPMLMLLLTACGGGAEKDLAADLQAQYAAVAEAVMEADITCHYKDEVRTYTMLCAYTPLSSTITVLAPANLAGISATVAEGQLQLSYEDVSLDAGSYSAAAISPIAALPNLMEAAASGYITEQSGEELNGRSCLRLACDLPDDDSTLYATWFDQETLLPLRSEISSGGEVAFEVAWTRFEVSNRGTGSTADASSGGEDAPAGEDGAPAAGAPEDAWTEADEAAAYAEAED